MLNPLDLSADAPWKKRFRAPALAWSVRATRKPERGLIASNKDGVYQLYAWDTATDDLRQLTDEAAGVVHGAISADGERVYYLRDKGGDEIGRYVSLPFNGGAAQDISPDLPDYASHSISESHAGNALGFMAVDDAGFHAYVYAADQMEQPRFAHSKGALSFGPYLSQAAEIAVIASTEKTGVAEYALEAYDVASGALIAELWDGAGSGTDIGGFSPLPGDMRFAGSSSAGGYHRPFIWNPQTGERQDIASEQFSGDVKAWHWSPDAQRLLLHQVHHARHTLYVYDLSEQRARKLDTPPGVFSPGSGFLENDRLQVHLTDSTEPTRLLELDANSGQVLRKVIDLGVDAPAGSPWRSVTYQSSGGAEIQAWLATPPGDGPFPTIVHTHGGPTAVQTNTWKPDAQAWLDHGFAFFSLNYRGSTTFGYDFQHAIDGNLGDLEVDDIAAGVDWLLKNGIAQPGALLKTGTSYGGYLTLQSLGRQPQLFAGGMAIVAIADWTLMYEDQAGTLRGYQRSMFGGAPDEKPEAHRKASPITYAADIQAPILVLQGENDTRCPARQMRVYEQTLKDLGKSIDIYWFDAGHGSLAIAEQIHHQELMLEFAYWTLNRPPPNRTKRNIIDKNVRKTIRQLMALRGVKVDREAFLRSQLRSHVDKRTVDHAIATNPASAKIPRHRIDRIADAVIRNHVWKAGVVSFAAGVPGGLAMLATVPADAINYSRHSLVLAQKLAYLYGWPDMLEQGKVDDETERLVLLLLGEMWGVKKAGAALSQISAAFAGEIVTRIPRQALTKTIYYNALKSVLRWVGISLNKRLFAQGIAKAVPVISGFATGSMTTYTLRRGANRLKKHLRTLEFAKPSQESPAATISEQ